MGATPKISGYKCLRVSVVAPPPQSLPSTLSPLPQKLLQNKWWKRPEWCSKVTQLRKSVPTQCETGKEKKEWHLWW